MFAIWYAEGHGSPVGLGFMRFGSKGLDELLTYYPLELGDEFVIYVAM